MGLDCTAYEKVKLVKAISLAEMEKRDWQHPKYDEDTGLFLFNDQNFEERADGLVEGIYTHTGKKLSFRAGSYSGYNAYRSKLAQLLGKTDKEVWRNPQPGPFMEQINFSDCEGFLGPKTCAKLLEDYKAHEEAFGSHFEPFWLDLYKQWVKALEIAAGEGVVTFH